MTNSIDKIIEAQTGAAFELPAGSFLKVIDPQGRQVSDLFCARKEDLNDTLSAGRSIDYNDTIQLTTGHLLYSHQGIPVLEIIEDTCGRHDFLVTPCSLQMFQMIARDDKYHPSCHENLALAMSPYGFDATRISTTFNIFMNVPVANKGGIKVEAPLSRAGDFIVFKALADLIVGLTACSDEHTNAGSCKPIRFQISSCI